MEGVSVMNDKDNMIPYYSFPWRVCSDAVEVTKLKMKRRFYTDFTVIVRKKTATNYRTRPQRINSDDEAPHDAASATICYAYMEDCFLCFYSISIDVSDQSHSSSDSGKCLAWHSNKAPRFQQLERHATSWLIDARLSRRIEIQFASLP